MPTLTEEIRARFERNYTNLVLGAELSLEGQTQVVSDVGHLLKAFDKATAQIARKDESLKALVEAITLEVNEKGAGGYLLARLSDARNIMERRDA